MISPPLFLIFIVLCFHPIDCGYHISRRELKTTIWNILISPFGLVRFKDFFFADVITSAVHSMIDIGIMLEYFTSGNWRISQPVTDQTQVLKFYIMLAAYLPFWWRFW